MKRTAIIRKSMLRKVSKRREKENRIYSAKRKAFLEKHPYCQLWILIQQQSESDIITYDGWAYPVLMSAKRSSDPTYAGLGCPSRVPASVDIHHIRGRIGAMLNDERYWLAVSREGHDFIHSNPTEARRIGVLI